VVSDDAPAARTAMIRKLRAGGVFIDEVETHHERQDGARRRRDE